MADIYTEADEALKQERLARLWEEYGIYLIIFVVATILLTGALSMYKSWDRGVEEQQTADIIALQAASDYPANVLALENPDFRPGLRAILYLNAAGMLVQDGKREDALTLYQRLSEDKAVDAEFRDLGTLMSVRLQQDDEAISAEDLLGKLEPIYSAKNALWGPHARLEAAVIEAHKNADLDAAIMQLDAIRDTEGLPESLYQKAEALSHLYSMQAAQQPAAEQPASE